MDKGHLRRVFSALRLSAFMCLGVGLPLSAPWACSDNPSTARRHWCSVPCDSGERPASHRGALGIKPRLSGRAAGGLLMSFTSWHLLPHLVPFPHIRPLPLQSAQVSQHPATRAPCVTQHTLCPHLLGPLASATLSVLSPHQEAASAPNCYHLSIPLNTPRMSRQAEPRES